MILSGKPWRMLLPFAGFLVLCLAWSGYWLWISKQSQEEAEQWRADMAQRGIQVTCENETWGGYPFRIELRCSPGKISREGSSLTLTQLTILAQAYQLRHLLIVNDGETLITTPERELRLIHEGAIASVILGKHGQFQADANLTNVSSDDFAAATFGIHVLREDQQLSVAANIGRAKLLILPGEPVSVETASLIGSVQPVPESLEPRAMAEAGTRLTITGAEMRSGDTSFTGKGELGLTMDGRPDGALKGRIRNLDHVLEALAERGILEPEARMGAGALLGLMGANGPDGLRIDIAAREGSLWLGPFKLGELPPLF